jgi:hypothetical protein
MKLVAAALLLGACAVGPSSGTPSQPAAPSADTPSSSAQLHVTPPARTPTAPQMLLDPVQLANDWGRPDLIDQIRTFTDEANATLDENERQQLLAGLLATR